MYGMINEIYVEFNVAASKENLQFIYFQDERETTIKICFTSTKSWEKKFCEIFSFGCSKPKQKLNLALFFRHEKDQKEIPDDKSLM